MASCEKCWRDSYWETQNTGIARATVYNRIVNEHDCTLEEQAGNDAIYCTVCNRATIPQDVLICLNCWTNYRITNV